MTWTKLTEKIEDHIVTIVFALITILCLTIWQAIPSEVWIQLGAGIPKRALAAFIGLLLIALSTSLAYSFSLRRKLRNIRGEQQTKPSDERLNRTIMNLTKKRRKSCYISSNQMTANPLRT
jgi:uncharacterized membrane protein